MSTLVSSFQYGEIHLHRDIGVLELRWLPATRSMTDEDFNSGLRHLADQAEALGASLLLVDTAEFLHQFEDHRGTMQRRDEEIVPRYNASETSKFAFVFGEDFEESVERGVAPAAEGPAAFPTGRFNSRDAAFEWLAASP